jgi:hypothetical protein
MWRRSMQRVASQGGMGCYAPPLPSANGSSRSFSSDAEPEEKFLPWHELCPSRGLISYPHTGAVWPAAQREAEAKMEEARGRRDRDAKDDFAADVWLAPSSSSRSPTADRRYTHATRSRLRFPPAPVARVDSRTLTPLRSLFSFLRLLASTLRWPHLPMIGSTSIM